MRVTEIFKSIQGESTYAGLPCVFIRLTGCNLRCTWCDTEYAFHEGKEMTLDEVLTEVRRYHCRLVEVTGGEPLHQEETSSFIEKLCAEGYDCLIETSGAIDISRVDSRAHVIMDIKCPGSGMSERMYWKNVDRLTHKDNVKCVIQDRQDYEWARDVVKKYALLSRCPVLFAPVFGALDPKVLAEWILEDGLPVRLQLQLHKYIWAPSMRGV